MAHGRQRREHQKRDESDHPHLVIIGDATTPTAPIIFPVINSSTTIITNVAAKKQLNVRQDPALVRANRYIVSMGSDGVPVTSQLLQTRRGSPTKQRNSANLTPVDDVSAKSSHLHIPVEGSEKANYGERGKDMKPKPPAFVVRERDRGSMQNVDNKHLIENTNKCSNTVGDRDVNGKSSSASFSSSDSRCSPAQSAGAALGKALGLSFEPKNVMRVLRNVQEVSKEVKLTKTLNSPSINRSIDQSSPLRSANDLDVNTKTKKPTPPVVSAASNVKIVYKYKHVAGNNGRVILSNFRKRPWWHSGNDKKKLKGLPMDNDTARTNKESLDNSKKKDTLNFDFVWEMCR